MVTSIKHTPRNFLTGDFSAGSMRLASGNLLWRNLVPSENIELVMLAYLFAPELPDEATHPRPSATRAQSPGVPATTPDARSARDELWVRYIRAGDRDAFAQLYSEYASAMVGFIYRFVRSAHIAEDITEDVFVSVWERRQTWSPQHGARAYLFHAARMRALNYLRDHQIEQRATVIAARSDMLPGASSQPTPIDDRLDAEQRIVAARAIIATFPEIRRRVMELRWYHGLAIDEIAVIMEISRAAVDQHLSRGLRALRDVFVNDERV
jgi:RNA polymerase sigma-70 factor (family 1)